MGLKSIKSTSTQNIFILTYIDRMFHEFRLQLAYGDLTPIVTVEYPFSSYRYCCSSSRFYISQNYDPATMKKCVEEFLNAIDPEIDTSELVEKLKMFKTNSVKLKEEKKNAS